MSVPRYRVIADYLHELIVSSEADALLPSDAELCERFEVSRMTARNAVQLLVTEGLVYRRRGQGTFVAPRPVPRVLGSPLSFTESMRRRGLQASSQLLHGELIDADADAAAALHLDADSQVVLVERLRFTDGVPMALERARLIPELAGVLREDLVTGSLHRAMERAGHDPVRSAAHVSARLALPRERRLLDTSSDGVVLCEQRVISNSAGRPVEQTVTCYAAERYWFELTEHRDGSEAR